MNHNLPNICPFCGMPTGVPHETQEGCIQALHQEILRVRTLLRHVRPLVDQPEEERRTA